MIDQAKTTELQKLQQEEDMAYFRADLCLCSPESYTIDEKREICNDMARTTKAQLAAIRKDFDSMPPKLQACLLDMLCHSGVETPQWWWDVLVGKGDPLYKGFESLR